MADKWMQNAVKRPGAFTAKAKKHGMGVKGYMAKVLKPGSDVSGQTKKQAVLAKTFSKFRPH